jgi:hypothetical protein
MILIITKLSDRVWVYKMDRVNEPGFRIREKTDVTVSPTLGNFVPKFNYEEAKA